MNSYLKTPRGNYYGIGAAIIATKIIFLCWIYLHYFGITPITCDPCREILVLLGFIIGTYFLVKDYQMTNDPHSFSVHPWIFQ